MANKVVPGEMPAAHNPEHNPLSNPPDPILEAYLDYSLTQRWKCVATVATQVPAARARPH